ncbi:MAG: trigger factor [Planctomycetes bacterium]|nr:trigger factor [Planctomycetota bacterium]
MTDEETKDEQLGAVEDELDEEQEAEQAQGEGEGGGEGKEPSLEEKLKDVIDVKVENLASLRRKLTISVPRDMLDGQVNEQYDELRREALVPGFRKGRAPRRLLEKRFGHEVSETLVQQLVTNGYMAAVNKTALKVLGDPLIYVKGEDEGESEVLEEVTKAIEKITLPPEGALTFSCEVEIRPEFELPPLEGIPLERPMVSVTDEDVNRSIERFRAGRGTYEAVTEGGIQEDDLITADLKMASEGRSLKEQAGVRLAARPQVVDGVALEKLGEVLAGAKVGDTVTIDGTIPDDYVRAEFRGKPARLELAIKEIQRLKLPELNEEFLKAFALDSEQELRDFVRQDLESHLDEEIRRAMRGQVARYLTNKVSFDLPERLSNRQIAQVTASRILELYRQGVPQAEVEKHADELKTSSREEAIGELKLAFIMEKLAEEIEVEVSEGEVNTMIASIARRQGQRFDRIRDQLAKEGGLTTLYLRLRDDKILDQLISNAAVTEKTIEEMKAGGKASDPAGPADRGEAPTAAGGEEASGGFPPTPREQVRRTPPKKGKTGEDSADET